MIPRYARKEMTDIWEPENKYRIWLKIEVTAAEAMAEFGMIPKEAAEAAKARGGFDIDRIRSLLGDFRGGHGVNLSSGHVVRIGNAVPNITTIVRSLRKQT